MYVRLLVMKSESTPSLVPQFCTLKCHAGPTLVNMDPARVE